MCSALAHGGHQVILTAIGNEPNRARDYNLIMLPWRSCRLCNRLMQAITTICLWRLRPDILFTRSPLLGLPGLRCGVQVVVELHSLPGRGSKTRDVLRRILRLPRLRRIVTISRAMADDMVADTARRIRAAMSWWRMIGPMPGRGPARSRA